jgi:tetratricopeptide (TPR) repeat protein
MVKKHRSLTPATVLRAALVPRAATVLGAALLLAGCPSPWPRPSTGANPSTIPPQAAPPPAPAPAPIPPAPATPRPQSPPRENHLSPATRSLVTQAHGLLAHGDIDGAYSTLDRALRIEPSNPLLWIELGRVRLVESDAHQAENCARKALALASGDRTAQAQAGRLLADALRAQGRNPEAQEVESRPYMH